MTAYVTPSKVTVVREGPYAPRKSVVAVPGILTKDAGWTDPIRAMLPGDVALHTVTFGAGAFDATAAVNAIHASRGALKLCEVVATHCGYLQYWREFAPVLTPLLTS